MLYDTIQNEIKKAMLERDNVRRDCLRSLVSEIKNNTINAGKPLTEEVVVKCVQKAVKQHADSIEQFTSAGRDDLVSKEKAELEILSKYLPKLLSEDATKEVIAQILKTIEPIKKNMGLVMKQLPKEVDRRFASQYLNTILN